MRIDRVSLAKTPLKAHRKVFDSSYWYDCSGLQVASVYQL